MRYQQRLGIPGEDTRGMCKMDEGVADDIALGDVV